MKKQVFILAGQSNMSGRGGVQWYHGLYLWDDVVPDECAVSPSILCLSVDLNWEEARDPLHIDIESKSKTCGVGPGMSFANHVLKETGCTSPNIGLVPCAIGGTAIKEWEKGSKLYNQMVQRAKTATEIGDGGEIKAILWYQGEHYSVEINWPRDIQEKNVPRETYHLYARCSMGHVNQILQQKLKGLGTLSMYLSGCSGYLGHQYTRQSNLTKFVALRVLELDGDFTEIPDFILELKHLVYLGITSSKLKSLPLSIGLLYNLQTLILDHCHLLEYLPESIGDLANLQYLYIQSNFFKRLPKSLCSSKLLRLVIKSDHLEEVPLDLENLHNLHELTIFSHQQTLAIHNTIGSLSSLEKLNLLDYGNTLVGCVPHGLVNFPAIKKMATGLRVKKWQQGRLSIEGIKMSNLVNAQRANLRNKYRLEALDLCWDRDDPDYDFLPVWKPETCEGGSVGANDVDFSLLECLQPHPNLKKLLLSCYPSTTLPRWMRDPFSLQSIQEISLKYCFKIQSLPFGKLHTVKHLNILSCFSIRVLQLEKLPSRLETLQISNCNYLELITGQGYQDNLSLVINYCGAFKSITRNTEPHIARERVSSLPRLKIECYDLLCLRPLKNNITQLP